LKNHHHDTPASVSASRIRSPRIGADRLSLRQPRAVAEPGPNPVWTAVPARHRSVTETTFFDAEYAEIRATLLSLARDGHRLLGRIAADHAEPDSRVVRGFLQRIDQFDEQVAQHDLEPVRRWVHQLKCLVLDTAAAHS
jgi:hypothetical protein